jgi:hypothetical protein
MMNEKYPFTLMRALGRDVSAAGARSSPQRHAMTAMRSWHLFVKARIYGDSCGVDGTGAVRRCHDAKEVGASFHGAPMVWHTVPHGHFMAPLRTGARRRCNDSPSSVMRWRVTPWHLPGCGIHRGVADAGVDIDYRSNAIQNVFAFLLEFLIRQ